MACGWCCVCCEWLCCEVSVQNQSSDRNLPVRHDIDRWFEYNEAKDSCNECSCNNRYLTAYVAVHSYINQKCQDTCENFIILVGCGGCRGLCCAAGLVQMRRRRLQKSYKLQVSTRYAPRLPELRAHCICYAVVRRIYATCRLSTCSSGK